MTYELIIAEKRTGKAWDAAPQVTQAVCTTNRTGSPGTLKFNILASGISFVEGDPVRFSVDGQLIFLGWVFTKTRDRYAVIDVICYDQLRYLKAQASYCFVGRTAGEIIREIAQDLQLTVGEAAPDSLSKSISSIISSLQLPSLFTRPSNYVLSHILTIDPTAHSRLQTDLLVP